MVLLIPVMPSFHALEMAENEANYHQFLLRTIKYKNFSEALPT